MKTFTWLAFALFLLMVILFSLAEVLPGYAMDHGFDKSSPVVQWFERQQRPDYPGSCCGKGDAYEVSSYWNNHDGTWTAVIGDGSAKRFPDGTTRPPIPDGTTIIVPETKVNPAEDDLDNPTDKSWIYMSVYDNGGTFAETVYCLIRHPQGT